MNESLQDALAPVIDFLDTLDPADSKSAELLNARFPVNSEPMQAIAALFEAGVRNRWLCNRHGGPGVTYSRVAKQVGQSEMTIDAVRMDAPGPGHSHPNGEFDLSFAALGDPNFDGQGPGWTVYPPGSWHVPTVSGGTMNILYFLPGGAIEFAPKPE